MILLKTASFSYLCLILTAFAIADEITLKNGEKIHYNGIFTKDDSGITLEIENGLRLVEWTQIIPEDAKRIDAKTYDRALAKIRKNEEIRKHVQEQKEEQETHSETRNDSNVISKPTSLPRYEIAGTTTSTVGIAVAKNTTRQQLTELVHEFRKARMTNTFNKLIPPTTPRGSKGPYFVVTVYILDDATYGTGVNLDRFTLASNADPFAKEFADHILAYYYYTQLSNYEEGSLGYSDSQTTTGNYKKLF